jgi:uncharacterized membrane protein YdjX (TVP38/TMEM64 family)
MTREQIIKILKVSIIATIIILGFEIIFDIPAVNTFFSRLIEDSNGVWAYLVIWLIMFLQCTILNIPAYIVLSASISIGIDCLSWEYLLTVITAYMCGCILAYWLGRWFGVRAVKWCAGSNEDFEKWSRYINTKGKWWYFATVLFPLFPDDILCLIAGSIRFNFGFYVIANLIGRSIGLICMILFLKIIGSMGGGFPFMLVVWAVILIAEIVLLCILCKRKK